MRAPRWVLLVTALVALGAVPQAQASSALGETYVAALDETNHLTVTFAYRAVTHDYAVTYTDTGTALIVPGPDCTSFSATVVTCAPVTAVTVSLLNENDFVTASGHGPNTSRGCMLTVRGGAGNDTLHGSPLADCIYGESGNDFLDGKAGPSLHGGPTEELHGGQGSDYLFGGSGPDLLMGEGGTDTMIGGPGRDTVSYAGRGYGIRAAIGTRGNGHVDENDSIGNDVENLIGAEGGDFLKGNSAANRLEGRGGRDTLVGGPGGDDLRGGDGDDRLYAGYLVRRHSVAERPPRPDHLRGGAGSDSLFTHDEGADPLVDGGPGADTAHVDGRLDTVRRVEHVFS